MCKSSCKGLTIPKKINLQKTRYDRNPDPETYADLIALDKLTESEIADGNSVAHAGGQDGLDGIDNIEHDGVVLSIHGSDVDEFSDEETTNRESGEIVSSDGEDEQQVVIRQVEKQNDLHQRKRVTGTTQNKGLLKFQHLQDDPDFNSFLDQMLDRKLSDKHGISAKRNGKGNDETNGVNTGS